MKLSIVSTLYQSAPYIEEFYQRATAVATKLVGDNYEIILVNDGSPDDSLKRAIALTQLDLRLVVLDLSKNFGHHRAIMTGLAYCQGDRIFLIDSDLEEDPDWLLDFHRQMDRENCDVVFGVQKRRKGSWFERWSGQWFYHLFNALTGLQLPPNIVTARLMTRSYLNALLKHREREVFLAGLFQITGFCQQPHWVSKGAGSETTYSFSRKISLAINSVTSFSNTPLEGIFYIGLCTWTFSLIYIIYLLVNWFFISHSITGWTSIMASIWFLGGMIISCIGVVGIYLSKIFSETKQRPYTIVKSVYTSQPDHMLRSSLDYM